METEEIKLFISGCIFDNLFSYIQKEYNYNIIDTFFVILSMILIVCYNSKDIKLKFNEIIDMIIDKLSKMVSNDDILENTILENVSNNTKSEKKYVSPQISNDLKYLIFPTIENYILQVKKQMEDTIRPFTLIENHILQMQKQKEDAIRKFTTLPTFKDTILQMQKQIEDEVQKITTLPNTILQIEDAIRKQMKDLLPDYNKMAKELMPQFDNVYNAIQPQIKMIIDLIEQQSKEKIEIYNQLCPN